MLGYHVLVSYTLAVVVTLRLQGPFTHLTANCRCDHTALMTFSSTIADAVFQWCWLSHLHCLSADGIGWNLTR